MTNENITEKEKEAMYLYSFIFHRNSTVQEFAPQNIPTVPDSSLVAKRLAELVERVKAAARLKAKENMQEVADDLERQLSGRDWTGSGYSTTDVVHGVRSSFNKFLGIDEALEKAFQNGEDFDFPIQVKVFDSASLRNTKGANNG